VFGVGLSTKDITIEHESVHIHNFEFKWFLVFSFVISSLRFLELGLCIQNLEYLVFGF
jgi:hypothetical protein